jgi:RNA polymerase sigma factor (sigma-70 family)
MGGARVQPEPPERIKLLRAENRPSEAVAASPDEIERVYAARRIGLRQAFDLRERPLVALEDELDAELILSERDPELAAAIRRLPPRRRLIVFLRYYGDLSYQQIGELIGISAGTVGAALAQAHDELRAALELEGAER